MNLQIVDHHIVDRRASEGIIIHRVRLTRDLSALCDIDIAVKKQIAIALRHMPVRGMTSTDMRWTQGEIVSACEYAETIALAR